MTTSRRALEQTTLPRVAALLAALVASACGASQAHAPVTPPTPRRAPDLAYEAVRWIPTDVSYAVVSKRLVDVIPLAASAADAIGMVTGRDAGEVAALSRATLGFSLASTDDLERLGVDPARGAAVFGRTPFELTAVAALASPGPIASISDALICRDAAVRRERADGIELRTCLIAAKRSVSWAVLDGWLLVHVDAARARNPSRSWLRDARDAEGTFVRDADFRAAVRLGARTSPLIGVFRPGKAIDELASIALADTPVARCHAFLGQVHHVLFAASRDRTGASFQLVAKLPGVEERLHPLAAPPLQGRDTSAWRRAVQIDIGVDLPATVEALGACAADLGLVALLDTGIRTLHLAAGFRGSRLTEIAGYASLTSDAWIHMLLHRIPGLSWLRAPRTVRGLEVHDVETPSFAFSYHLTPAIALIAAPAPSMASLGRIVDGHPLPVSDLVHIKVDLEEAPPDAWQLLRPFGASESLVRSMATMGYGELVVRAEGDRLSLSAAWRRRR